MPEKRIKTAQVNLRIEPALKAAAEKAAAADHRSLTGLIEKLLSDYCKRRNFGPTGGRRPNPEAASKASKLAARELEPLTDKSLPPEERDRRKRVLIRGPKEFRDIRGDLPKKKG
jgi:hypothetical protein